MGTITPEANRRESERKVGAKARKQEKKHMPCVFSEKSEQKNPLRKLIGMCRSEKWVWKRENRRKNTCCVFLGKKASGKTQKPER